MSIIPDIAMENTTATTPKQQPVCADTSGSAILTESETLANLLNSNSASDSQSVSHSAPLANPTPTTTTTPTTTAATTSPSSTPPVGTQNSLLNGGLMQTSATTPNKHTVNPSMSSNNTNNNNTATNVKSCAGCGARIVDRFLLHAMDRYWHTGCLKCSCCQAQLGEIGTSCFTKAGMILCKNDYIRLFGSSGTCAACSNSIPAQEFVMRAQNNVYHVNCFTCVTCHQRLVPGDRYSIVNGSLICEQDYPKVLKGHTAIPMRPTHKVNNNNNNTNINNRNESEMLPYY